MSAGEDDKRPESKGDSVLDDALAGGLLGASESAKDVPKYLPVKPYLDQTVSSIITQALKELAKERYDLKDN